MSFLIALVRVYMLVILVRAVFSWLPERHRQNELYHFVRTITEPVLRPIRRVLPTPGGIDFSPLVAIIALQVLARLLLGL
ncbi:MAG: YggT family protein [Candidatus Brocadiia bacterium]